MNEQTRARQAAYDRWLQSTPYDDEPEGEEQDEMDLADMERQKRIDDEN